MQEERQRNTRKEFKGLPHLKAKQAEQLQLFEEWAGNNDWRAFHHNHFDWWMFPIELDSSYGYAYTVYAGDVAELQEDEAYMASYRRGVELLVRSWGWDIQKNEFIETTDKDQCYKGHDIRLRKVGQSLKLFGQEDYFASLDKFLCRLHDERGHHFNTAPSEKRGLWPFSPLS